MKGAAEVRKVCWKKPPGRTNRNGKQRRRSGGTVPESSDRVRKRVRFLVLMGKRFRKGRMVGDGWVPPRVTVVSGHRAGGTCPASRECPVQGSSLSKLMNRTAKTFACREERGGSRLDPAVFACFSGSGSELRRVGNVRSEEKIREVVGWEVTVFQGMNKIPGSH